MVVNGIRIHNKSIYGTGSSLAHAYYVTKWRTTYTQLLFKWKKMALDEVSILENCGVMEMRLRK